MKLSFCPSPKRNRKFGCFDVFCRYGLQIRTIGWVDFHEGFFLLPWCKRNKRSSLKIKSLKTSSKFRSVARAVRPSSSLADCCHFTSSLFSYTFYLRAFWEGCNWTYTFPIDVFILKNLFFCLDFSRVNNLLEFVNNKRAHLNKSALLF